MGESQLLTWMLTGVLVTIGPALIYGANSQTTDTTYKSNGYFHFEDKNHRQQYNYYQHVTEAPQTTGFDNDQPWTNEVEPPTAAEPTFSYRDEDEFGPSNWGALSAACNGMYQSPINLIANRSLVVHASRPVTLVGLWNRPWRMAVENEGGSAAFFPEFKTNQERPRLRGGPLKVDYVFQQFHYHLGSEHAFNGKHFAAEVHVVFYNSLYDSFDSAADQVDGIAVVAIIFEVLKNNRIRALNSWTRHLDKVVEDESEYDIPSNGMFSLAEVIRSVRWPYYAYEGSFTTPPCSESVQWIVASERMPLAKAELRRMQKLKGRGGEWLRNARPIQARNYRRVFIY